MEALAAFRNTLKEVDEIEEDSPQQDEQDKPKTQNDILATARTDVIDDDPDENAENGTLGWMNHKLKFVKHFEDNLRDGSFEPGADMYVTDDPLEMSPVAKQGCNEMQNGLESVKEKVELRKRPISSAYHRPERWCFVCYINVG